MGDVAEVPAKQCSNPECNIAHDGRCIEGFPQPWAPDGCSHYGKALVIVETEKVGIIMPLQPGVRLPGAEALSVAAAQSVLRNLPSNVVAIVGPHECGKTSLIGGIYDLLQHNKVGCFAFAGTSTPHAFERACHDSRSASNRQTPHMERTERGDVTYFHLDLARADCGEKRAALFANRDGEAYMETQANPDLAKDFVELRRCDTLTIIADGFKLLDDSERHQVENDVRLTLRAFEESGQTRTWQRLALVMTKIDAVRNDKRNGARAIRGFDRISEEIREEFGPRFMDMQTFQVAASPKVDGADRGEGLADLLAYWMEEPGRHKHRAATDSLPVSTRSFGRLRPEVGGSDA